MFYVYKIINKINNKSYIGKSKDPLKRWRTHLKVAKGGKDKYPRKFQAIHSALKKYGVENFSFEIIAEFLTEEESFSKEMQEISYLRKNNLPTYNLSDGGEGNSGWHHTKESRKKMSKTRKGKPFSEEHKRALSLAQSGENHSQFGIRQNIEWRQSKSKLKISQVKEIKILISNKVKLKDIASMFNVTQSLISQIKTGKVWSEI